MRVQVLLAALLMIIWAVPQRALGADAPRKLCYSEVDFSTPGEVYVRTLVGTGFTVTPTQIAFGVIEGFYQDNSRTVALGQSLTRVDFIEDKQVSSQLLVVPRGDQIPDFYALLPAESGYQLLVGNSREVRCESVSSPAAVKKLFSELGAVQFRSEKNDKKLFQHLGLES